MSFAVVNLGGARDAHPGAKIPLFACIFREKLKLYIYTCINVRLQIHEIHARLCISEGQLRKLESFGTKSLDVRNTFFRHCLVNT